LVEHDLFRKPVSTFRDHALSEASSLSADFVGNPGWAVHGPGAWPAAWPRKQHLVAAQASQCTQEDGGRAAAPTFGRHINVWPYFLVYPTAQPIAFATISA
jgi:hypothetical protein